MATDYKKIVEDHEKRYGWDTKPRRIYKQLYSDKTHFIYELIQNADDSNSQHLELQLDSNALYVWNDGSQFKEKDVRSICSLGSSNKDLTHIGTFGIGFKAVYNYTDLPEIYSGEECFRIRDLIKPESIDNMSPEIEKLVNEGKTFFHLPFKDSPHQLDDIKHLMDRLCKLENERSLLFLRNLERIEWKDKRNAQTGYYSCHRQLFDKLQDIPDNESVELVKLTGSLNCNNKRSETFLVFSKAVKPQQNVIDKLLEQAEDKEDRQLILRSSEELQPIEVAFKLQDDGIIPIDNNCVLFAFLPTQKETHLKFLIQARYQTTPARDNIPKPHENPWNGWLVQETANFLPEILEQLKIGGLLKPAFFNVLPLKDNVENEFKPIAEALQKAMQERAFVPTEKEGNYAKAENVYYPHRESLRELIECDSLFSNSSWLHPDIRDTEEFRQCYKVMREAGVKEIGINQVLDWLDKQESNWFESKCEDWLRSLYLYLNNQKSELDRIKNLPLVRLENGEQVCAKDGLVFFPPNTDEGRKEIAPFLKELPILKSVLLEGDDSYEIEAFLKSLGVRALHPEDIINESICPKYLQPERPSEAQNRLHVRYLFKIWDKISDTDIKKKIKETPILHAYKGFQQVDSDFVVPCDAYLSQTYTDNTDLENYFSVYDSEIWFIDDAYLEDDSDQKTWFRFLKAIGTMDTPKVIEESLSVDYQNSQELHKRGLKLERSNYKQTIKDFNLQNLPEVLTEISTSQKVNLSQVLWRLLVNALPSGENTRNAFFSGNHHWFHYSDQSKSFDATFYRQLKETAWLPNEAGTLHCPSECFAPTSDNKKVLGDSVAYLHTDFDISEDKKTQRWLAEKLGVHLNANTNSVMKYLNNLSSNSSTVSVEDIEPMYRFLDRQDAQRKEEFKAKSLIFTPEPEPCWWQSDKVFWEDESAVFGDGRGYLKEYYSENLENFFNVSGVSVRAAPLDYVRGIQDVTSKKNANEEEIRKRVKYLYQHIWQFLQELQENNSSLEDEELQEEWEKTREGKCWLGKKGSEWDFFYKDELVWNDNNYIADIFDGKIPFWAFDGALLELAKHLGIEGCNQISDVESNYYGNQGVYKDWSEKVRGLSLYIQDFLNSMPRHEGHAIEKSAKVLDRLTVYRTQRIEVRYKLKGISVPDPDPRQSFLDTISQGITLWLGTEVVEGIYPDLVGDALQEYFGIDQLREFVKDLLLARDDAYIDMTLNSWKRHGFQADLCLSLPEAESKEDEENSAKFVDEKLPTDIDSEHDVSEMIEPMIETPIPYEVAEPETNSGDVNPAEDGYQTYTNIHNTSHSGGHWQYTPNRGNGGGGHRDRGGGRESDEHRNLKNYLADNPSLLSQGLTLVETEHGFKSGDKADILLEDSKGSPITVEVETHIPPRNYVGAWQAVKYKHLAAVEYGLPCNQVRSILAAPIIPDDVKVKCKELGIEPIEVPLPNDTRDSIA